MVAVFETFWSPRYFVIIVDTFRYRWTNSWRHWLPGMVPFSLFGHCSDCNDRVSQFWFFILDQYRKFTLTGQHFHFVMSRQIAPYVSALVSFWANWAAISEGKTCQVCRTKVWSSVQKWCCSRKQLLELRHSPVKLDGGSSKALKM